MYVLYIYCTGHVCTFTVLGMYVHLCTCTCAILCLPGVAGHVAGE